MTSDQNTSTPALKELARGGVVYEVHRVDLEDLERRPSVLAPNFGVQVAERLGSSEGSMFKTLITQAGDNFYCAVVPVEKELSLRKLARVLGEKKVKMASPRDVERLSGYVLGGVSPFAMRTKLPTVVDQSATKFDRVYVSAGARGLVAEVSPTDLIEVSSARTAPIAAW